MKRDRMLAWIGLLAITISGLAVGSQAQKTKVTFKFKDVVVPGAVSIDAYGINNKKVIVGDYTDAAGREWGLYLKGAKLYKPSCPGYLDTRVYAVSAAGTAAVDCGDSGGGRAQKAHGNVQQGLCDYIPCALLYEGPVVSPPCDCPWEIYSIIDSFTEVQVGGWAQDGQGNTHGFVGDVGAGTYQTLDVPGALNTEVKGMNGAGMIVLQAIDSAGLQHAYLYDGKSYQNIDVPGAWQSFVHGINNNGDMVYTVEDANGNSFGVFFYAALRQLYWFNQPDGRDNTRAYGLNDEVQTKTGVKLEIVGDYAVPGSNLSRAYEATVNIK